MALPGGWRKCPKAGGPGPTREVHLRIGGEEIHRRDSVQKYKISQGLFDLLYRHVPLGPPLCRPRGIHGGRAGAKHLVQPIVGLRRQLAHRGPPLWVLRRVLFCPQKWRILGAGKDNTAFPVHPVKIVLTER